MLREACWVEERLLTYLTILEVAAPVAVSLKLVVIVCPAPHGLVVLQGMQLVPEVTVRGDLQEGEQQCMLHLKSSIELRHKEITVKPKARECPSLSRVFQP